MKNPFGALFERRSFNELSAIGSSYDLAQFLLGKTRSTSGQMVTESTAMNVAAVYTGVNIRAELFATLPVDVVEYSEDGRSRTPRPTHPVARVLSQPNSWQTRSELLGMQEAHRLLRGNALMWKNLVSVTAPTDGLGRLRVQELIPLHPDKVEVIEPRVLGAPTEYKLHRKDGTQIDLPAAEVVHTKSISTDGRTGRSFLADMREVIGGALATQEHANSLWSRDATPSVVLKHPGSLGGPGSKAVNNLEESWESIYGRSKDKRRVAVLEEGMGIEQLSLTPEDGQFLQTSQDLRAQIAAALRVPPHLMGLSEKATTWGTGIEQLNIGLVVITLRPAVTIWEQRLNMDLIAVPQKFGIKFNLGAMLRGDAASQGQLFWLLRQMGAMSANDVRAMFDWNPIANGDIYLQPTNLAPLGTFPMTTGTGATQ